MTAADKLAQEAQQFLALGDSDYKVLVTVPGSLIYLDVLYRGKLIDHSHHLKYRAGRRHVLRAIREHRRFIEDLVGEGIDHGHR